MKASEIKPLFDRVLIKRCEVDNVTTGGIIVPETAKEKLNRGVVIATGSGLTDEPFEIVPGDVVLFTQYAGVEMQVEDDGEYLMCRNNDIIAKEEL